MSVIQALENISDIIYVYDGTLAGLMCCLHECVYAGELPCVIEQKENYNPTFLPEKHIETDDIKAKNVIDSICPKISLRALELTENVFLSCKKRKEILIIRFLLKGYIEGKKIIFNIADCDVSEMLKAEKHLMNERHLLLGFVRFSDYQGMLGAVITPKNFILPYIAGHFISRFSNENFIIYDKTHKAVLLYKAGKKSIFPVDDWELPKSSDDEEMIEDLWKNFYQTIAIKERYNPKCRMTHMPKRYWENMIEMKE